jgi:hypothetical protein
VLCVNVFHIPSKIPNQKTWYESYVPGGDANGILTLSSNNMVDATNFEIGVTLVLLNVSLDKITYFVKNCQILLFYGCSITTWRLCFRFGVDK